MGLDATVRRRLFGGLLLGAALAMLICGQTVLENRLRQVSFLIYWAICFVLTGLAAIVALRDLRDLQRRTRTQQKELFDSTLKEIEREARSRKETPDRHES
jgi:hypothetical protein